MSKSEHATSPFQARQPRRLSFSTLFLMLIMVVASGLGLLIYYASSVPAIMSEINAWLGRTDPVVDVADSRRAQVVFVLFVYTAPLGLGLLVYLLHFGINLLDRLTREKADQADEEFQME